MLAHDGRDLLQHMVVAGNIVVGLQPDAHMGHTNAVHTLEIVAIEARREQPLPMIVLRLLEVVDTALYKCGQLRLAFPAAIECRQNVFHAAVENGPSCAKIGASCFIDGISLRMALKFFQRCHTALRNGISDSTPLTISTICAGGLQTLN